MKRYLLLLAISFLCVQQSFGDCSGCGDAKGMISTGGGCLIIQMASICDGGTCMTVYVMCSGMDSPGGGTSCTCDLLMALKPWSRRPECPTLGID